MPPVLRWVSFHILWQFSAMSFLKIFSLPLPRSPAPFSLFMMHRYGLSIISLRSSMFFLYVLITLHLSLVKCSNHFSVFKAWYLEHPLNYSIFQGHFYLAYWSFHFQYFKLFFFHSLNLFIEFHFPVLYWIPYFPCLCWDSLWSLFLFC